WTAPSGTPSVTSRFERRGCGYPKRRFSRESWLVALHPLSFISRSISPRSRPRAPSPTGLPAPATGGGEKRPAPPPLGPRGGESVQHMGAALDAPVHQDVDAITNAIDNLGELIKGGT